MVCCVGKTLHVEQKSDAIVFLMGIYLHVDMVLHVSKSLTPIYDPTLFLKSSLRSQLLLRLYQDHKAVK